MWKFSGLMEKGVEKHGATEVAPCFNDKAEK